MKTNNKLFFALSARIPRSIWRQNVFLVRSKNEICCEISDRLRLGNFLLLARWEEASAPWENWISFVSCYSNLLITCELQHMDTEWKTKVILHYLWLFSISYAKHLHFFFLLVWLVKRQIFLRYLQNLQPFWPTWEFPHFSQISHENRQLSFSVKKSVLNRKISGFPKIIITKERRQRDDKQRVKRWDGLVRICVHLRTEILSGWEFLIWDNESERDRMRFFFADVRSLYDYVQWFSLVLIDPSRE